MTAQYAAEFLADLGSLNIVTDPEGQDRIFTDVHQLAVIHRVSAYDAAYLELALRRDIPLATLDQDLRRAATTAPTSTGTTLL